MTCLVIKPLLLLHDQRPSAYEYEEAEKIAKEIGIPHMTIDTSELGIKGFAENPPTGVISVNRNYLGNSKKLPRKRVIRTLRMAQIMMIQMSIDPGQTPQRNLKCAAL